MGTWGTSIKSNDTSADIYADFFDLYNEGKEPLEIKEKIIADNPDNSNDFWFALALALWETKSLSTDILVKVTKIVESESDLKLWKELDASDSDIKKRRIVLEKFIIKLNSVKKKPKPRKKPIITEPIFEKGACLAFKLKNGNFGGGIVLEADKKSGFGYNLIVTTRINKKTKPTISDFKNSNVLVANFGDWEEKTRITWYSPLKSKSEYSEIFENIGNILIKKNYSPNSNEIKASFSAGWNNIIETVNHQFEYEKKNGITKSFSINKLIKRKKWWKLF